MSLEFWRGKTVLLTGHTGFKGMWLTRILQLAGADVTGYALESENTAYEQIVDENNIHSIIGDIRDYDHAQSAFRHAKPEFVFHLAAQPLVLDAFAQPAYTFEVNVQGTVNVLECIRKSGSVKSVMIITTDKVYKNNEWAWSYREEDVLGDKEPYAASKACVEIIAHSYYETFLKQKGVALSTVRAGNVIGGGDTSKNRIIPDCIRASKNNQPIIVRNPNSVRPYQHVLEPLAAYLRIAQGQLAYLELAGQYNIGPNDEGCVTNGELVNLYCNAWGNGQTWECHQLSNAPHESGLLKLDNSKIRAVFGWQPKWDIQTAVEKTIEWEKSLHKQAITDMQIRSFFMRSLD